MGYTWTEYQKNDFLQTKTLKVEAQEGELTLYHYFDTLRWRYMYSIILKDTFILESKEYPHSDWELVLSVYKLMKGSNDLC